MSRPERKNRQGGKMGEKSSGNIVCPIPFKPVDFDRMRLQQQQQQQQHQQHHLPQSLGMPPIDQQQQQQQKQMLADQAHWNQLQRQNRQIAFYRGIKRKVLAERSHWQQLLWEQALLQSSQAQQSQQHQQAHQQPQGQQQQEIADFRANVVQTHEFIPLMAPRAQEECPEDAAMQFGLQHPHSDEAQTQQVLQEFTLFPSPLMETPPDNWQQQQHFQMKSEEADDEEPPQFFTTGADQMSLEEPRRQQPQLPAPQLISHMPATHEEAQRMWKIDQLQNGRLQMTPEEAQVLAEQSLFKW